MTQLFVDALGSGFPLWITALSSVALVAATTVLAVYTALLARVAKRQYMPRVCAYLYRLDGFIYLGIRNEGTVACHNLQVRTDREFQNVLNKAVQLPDAFSSGFDLVPGQEASVPLTPDPSSAENWEKWQHPPVEVVVGMNTKKGWAALYRNDVNPTVFASLDGMAHATSSERAIAWQLQQIASETRNSRSTRGGFAV